MLISIIKVSHVSWCSCIIYLKQKYSKIRFGALWQLLQVSECICSSVNHSETTMAYSALPTAVLSDHEHWTYLIFLISHQRRKISLTTPHTKGQASEIIFRTNRKLDLCQRGRFGPKIRLIILYNGTTKQFRDWISHKWELTVQPHFQPDVLVSDGETASTTVKELQQSHDLMLVLNIIRNVDSPDFIVVALISLLLLVNLFPPQYICSIFGLNVSSASFWFLHLLLLMLLSSVEVALYPNTEAITQIWPLLISDSNLKKKYIYHLSLAESEPGVLLLLLCNIL